MTRRNRNHIMLLIISLILLLQGCNNLSANGIKDTNVSSSPTVPVERTTDEILKEWRRSKPVHNPDKEDTSERKENEDEQDRQRQIDAGIVDFNVFY